MSSISSSKPSTVLPQGQLRYGAVEDAIDAARRRPGEFALYHSLAALARAIEQRHQGLGAACQVRDAAAERLIAAQSQQCLRGGIQIEDSQILIQQEYAGHETVEQLVALDSNARLI